MMPSPWKVEEATCGAYKSTVAPADHISIPWLRGKDESEGYHFLSVCIDGELLAGKGELDCAGGNRI